MPKNQIVFKWLILSVTLSMIPAFGAGPPYEMVVPDENFRKAIDKAFQADGLRNLLDEATPDSVKDKGIINVDALQWLTKAILVDLSHNKIIDWPVLDLKDLAEPNKHYGGINDNVEWIVSGNPFSILPQTFGGGLVIDQPATTASVYDENFRPRVSLRGSEPSSQLFNITRCGCKNRRQQAFC